MSSSSTHVEKVVIIGSGPAGWTAAIYAARANLSPLAIIGVPASNPAPVLPGGQLMLTTEVENYPGFPHGVSGPEMMDKFREQAVRFETRVLDNDVVQCDFHAKPMRLTLCDGKVVETRSVIIATGATANWIGCSNELRLAQSGGGVSACAVCDGALPVFRNKVLAVVGGGDTAMEEASYLTKFASKVYIIHRRDSFRASRAMQARVLEHPKVEVLWNSTVIDVLGERKIEAIEVENTQTKVRTIVTVAGLFVAIGHSPATKFLQGSGVEFDEKGYVQLRTRSSETNLAGVFAAGDVADANYRQAVSAAGMGCQAAIDCERYLATQGVH
ncbi:MAG: thioredoxin-disulfide reductase [Phycisphaerales bacterium]|nr:thioredoxin-disulfide reductase [Phycisphaerales bacterium]